MAGTPYIDRVTTLDAVERHGVIRSMTRLARVVFAKTDIPRGAPGKEPYNILEMALNTLSGATPAIKPFSRLTDMGYDALVLVERAPKVAENEPTCVDVTLKYEHILEGPTQQINTPNSAVIPGVPAGALIFGKGRSSITEKTTNFYYPQGNPNNGRVLILTAHTYPNWEVGVVGMPLNPALPRTVIQGGEVSVPFPQANFTLNGVVKALNNSPQSVADAFIARINSTPWMGKPAFTWICSEVQWQVLSPAQSTYNFSWEFQYNIDTWNPTVAFNDQRTGRPPYGILFATLNATPQARQAIINSAALLIAQAVLAAANGNASLANSLTAQAAAMTSNVNSFGIFDGVARLTTNPVNGAIQPAGVWTVPALQAVDFNQQFVAFFQGINTPGFA